MWPLLTPVAPFGLAVMMLDAGAFHALRRGYRNIWGKLALFLAASLIASADRPTVSLLVETHATREGLEPRVGAERIETRPQEDAWVEPFVVSLLEPGHRLIPVAERCVDHGNLRGI
jgi:hypothetical protein